MSALSRSSLPSLGPEKWISGPELHTAITVAPRITIPLAPGTEPGGQEDLRITRGEATWRAICGDISFAPPFRK